ncbi:MAG: hypothetical protein HY820_11010 [Acidobacteria bacterium]|nr:hypothetical protein [Acidobacteriota bacterium]
MPSLYEIKEQEITDTPVVLFECQQRDGTTYRWSTHELSHSGQPYEARILRHDAFDLRFGTDRMTDVNTRLTVTVANLDSALSQGEAAKSWKGASLTARFAFYDLVTDLPTSEVRVLFRGACTGVEEINETSMRLGFSNRLAMSRVWLPGTRVQRRCPWLFPSSADQRAAGKGDGADGKYSSFYKCGYSAGVVGGEGNLSGGAPYASCGYTMEDCSARGMLDTDENLQSTKRFGGMPLLPTPDERGAVAASGPEYVPIVYGTGWVQGIVIGARNDGKSTQYEILLAGGPVQGVQKVVANGYEIPEGSGGSNGWFRLVSQGARTGAYATELGTSGGPHGSTAYLYLNLPNSMQRSGVAPRVDALVDGMILPRFTDTGAFLDETFTSNPAWVALDVLRRSGWQLSEIDVASFGSVAQYCDQTISVVDGTGVTSYLPRYRCHLVLQSRTTSGEVLRSIRTGNGLFLRYNSDGRLELVAEAGMATQQSSKPEGSNSISSLNGGWAAYEFGDGTHGFSGIARKGNGEPSIRFSSRSTSDTPNRCSLEFVDELNHYQTDSASLVDVDDVERTGQEIQTSLGQTGIGNYHQALRILRRQLRKSIQGNYYAEFLTSVRGVSLRPGDLITLTYLKEGLDRTPFRVLSISPALNFSSVQLLAQIHDDAWYVESGLTTDSGQQQPGLKAVLPRPISGTHYDGDGIAQYDIAEHSVQLADGGGLTVLSAGFTAPKAPAGVFGSSPTMSLAATVTMSGGTLSGGQTLFYGITASNADGAEGSLSLLTRAVLPVGSTIKVTLNAIALPAEAVTFNVYRGGDPSRLLQIAGSVSPSSTFVDAGAVASFVLPPDANYDHANFYWREEVQPPVVATIFGGSTIGNGSLSMVPNSYSEKSVWISKGTGAGQERRVASNTTTTLTVNPGWETTPDGTSTFCVTEGNWHFGVLSNTRTADFEVPNRAGMVVEVMGRAANTRDQEVDGGAPVSRWYIGGAAGAELDAGPPPAPSFGISTDNKGMVQVTGIGFSTLTNTRSIETGTLNLHYWNELSAPTGYQLTVGLTSGSGSLDLSAVGTASAGTYIQIGAEILQVQAVESGGTTYQVTRGVLGSFASSHAAGDKVYHLSAVTHILSFPHDFFGSAASGQYAHSIPLVSARVAAAELFVSNSKGISAAGQQSYAILSDLGLRTLSGGQLSMEVPGYLAVQTSAAPLLISESVHVVRDVFARVAEAPTGGPLQMQVKVNGSVYCTLTIAAGATTSNVFNGGGSAPLPAQGVLSLDITAVPTGGSDSPGRDLTVTIRL